MTSKEGQVLSWGLNTKMSNPTDLTRHAEVNAIAAYFCNHPNAKELPAGVQFFTSLKPCRMCAGAIADATASAFDRLQVVYGQNDPTQSSTCINTQERELVHLFSETLNKNYGSIKHDIHTLCAADSLDHPIMGNLAHRAIEAFDDARRAATSASLPIIEHLKKFYKICTGESLLDSH